MFNKNNENNSNIDQEQKTNKNWWEKFVGLKPNLRADLYITKENKFITFKSMNKKRCSINYIKLNDNNYLIYSSAFGAELFLIHDEV